MIEKYVQERIENYLKRYTQKRSTGENIYVGRAPDKEVLESVEDKVAQDLADVIAMGIFYGSGYIDEHFDEEFSENLTKRVAEMLRSPNF